MSTQMKATVAILMTLALHRMVDTTPGRLRKDVAQEAW
jgi:hypothetical protein